MHFPKRASSTEAKATSILDSANTACRCFAMLGLLLASMQGQAANILVDTLDDSINKDKACSLREAIINANNNSQLGSKACVAGEPGLDAIVFDPELGGGTIALTEMLPTIKGALSITGPVPDHVDGLMLDGQNTVRIMRVEGNVPNAFTVTLQGLTLWNGRANDGSGGAGIFAFNADLELIDIVVAKNASTGTGSRGGGLRVGNGNVKLTRTAVSDNHTVNEMSPGGGLSVVNGNVHLIDSIFSGNQTFGDSSPGGAIATLGGNIGASNSTISGNTALGEDSLGGGLYTSTGNITLLHATLAYNTSSKNANDGDNVHQTDPADNFTLFNSLIVQSNPAPTSCSKQADIKNSSLATHAGCTGVATPAGNIMLGALAFNGGPTQTHALGPFSDALETADKGICNSLDQRGAPRPFPAGGQCDIGAFESTGFLDMGDAPTAAQSGFTSDYPSIFIHNAAGHAFGPKAPFLGALIDVESNGKPNAGASGDDNDNLADEDGVFFTSDLRRGQDATVDITVSNGPAILDAWVDFNADGDFDDANEQIFIGQPVADGNNPGVSFAVPGSARPGGTFARFRLSTAGGLSPRGLAADGEVEDYAVTIAKSKKGGGGGGGGCSMQTGTLSDPLLPLFMLMALVYLMRAAVREKNSRHLK